MIKYLCCALKAFKDAKFLFYHLTFLYNQIRGHADSIVLFLITFGFSGLFPKLSGMLVPVTCLFQVTRIWDEEKNPAVCFTAESCISCHGFCIVCLNSYRQKYRSCAISADLRDF